jgi:hypothetical protein
MLETWLLVTELDMEEDQTIMSPSDHTREELKIELDGSKLEPCQVQCKHKFRVLVDTA